MQTEKYKQVARDIADILQDGYSSPSGRLEAYEPAEFEAGVTFALALYLHAMFRGELTDAYTRTCENLRLFMEELDSKGHPDDMIDITGFKL